jgi:hypothetical protein
MIETTIMLKPEFVETNRTLLGFIKIPRPDSQPRNGVRAKPSPDIRNELSQKLTQVPGYVPGFSSRSRTASS